MKSNLRGRATVMRAGLLASLAAAFAFAGCNAPKVDESYLSARKAVSATMQGGPGYLLAGVSIDPNKKVVPLDSTTLSGRIDSHQLHVFEHRCGACHQPPDPRIKKPYEWDAVVSQMQRTVSSAGLLPIGSDDRAVITDFLTEHARRDD